MLTRPRLVLTAWYTGILVAVIVAMALVVALTLERRLDGDIRDQLNEAADAVVAGEAMIPDEPAEARDPGWLALVRTVPSEILVVVTDGEGAVVANPRGVDTDELDLDDQVEELAEHADEGGPQPYRELAGPGNEGFALLSQVVGGSSPSDPGAVVIHVGESLSARNSLVGAVAGVTAISGLLGAAITLVAGYFLAGRTLRPVDRAVAAQRQFLSDASHELRTPLTVIRTNAELMARHPDETVEAQLESVEAIVEESERATAMLSNLLLLARSDEGAIALVSEPLDLWEVVTEAVRDLAPVAEAREVRLTSEGEGARLIGDAERLRQVVAILVDNATKHTPPGGRVTVAVHTAGASAVFQVRDTGPGIPEQYRRQIFDRFYRIDKARSREQGGSGLGLAIAKWIVEAHRGTITVGDSPEGGAQFEIRLPRG